MDNFIEIYSVEEQTFCIDFKQLSFNIAANYSKIFSLPIITDNKRLQRQRLTALRVKAFGFDEIRLYLLSTVKSVGLPYSLQPFFAPAQQHYITTARIQTKRSEISLLRN